MRKGLWTLVVLVCPLTSLGLDLNLMGGPIALAPGIDTSFSFQLWVQSEEAFNGAQFLFLFDNDEMNDLWSVSSVDPTGNTSGMARLYPGYTLAAGQSLRQVADGDTVEVWFRPDGDTPPGTYFMATVTMVPLADLTTCPNCLGFHTLRIPDHWNVMDAYGNPIGTGVPLEIYIGGPYPECSTDEDCDDGDLCTIGTCDGMNCFFEPVWCPEGEVCDPETGECVAEYTAPVLIEASSVMTHGTAGNFAINLNLASPWSIESRREAQITQHRFKFVFDQPIDISGAVVILSHGSHNGTLTLEGDNVLVATMATSPNPAPLNNVCLTINISGVKDVSGQYEMAPAVIRARLILGDVNFSGVANILDLSAVKTQIFISPSAANFIFDVDASGSIAILDMNAVKSNLFGTATCP